MFGFSKDIFNSVWALGPMSDVLLMNIDKLWLHGSVYMLSCSKISAAACTNAIIVSMKNVMPNKLFQIKMNWNAFKTEAANKLNRLHDTAPVINIFKWCQRLTFDFVSFFMLLKSSCWGPFVWQICLFKKMTDWLHNVKERRSRCEQKQQNRFWMWKETKEIENIYQCCLRHFNWVS